MAAVAPLLTGPTWLDDPVDAEVQPELTDPRLMVDEIGAHNLLLAERADVPDSVRLFVEGLADDVSALPADAALRIDPYLLVSLQRALIAALRALENPDESAARRDLRVRLEQMRQVYRDLADARPLFEDRPVKALARWLSEALDAPQARLASTLGVSARTFQRWVSETDAIEPQGDDARRVRLIANVAGHLRHALTGRGALDWFEREHPMAGGLRPIDLINDPAALPELTRLAASTRSQLAS